MIRYNINSVTRGINNFGNYFADLTYTATLSASTETHFTIPNTGAVGYPKTANGLNKFIAVFSYDNSSPVWVSHNATAAVPAGHTMAASATSCVLQPNARVVTGSDTLSFISTGTPNVSVELYAIQE